MSQDERRPNWLSRVFGSDPRGEGPSITEEAVQPAAIIRQLENELVKWQSAYDALEAQNHTRREELDALRAAVEQAQARASQCEAEVARTHEERVALRAQVQASAAKIASELVGRRGLSEEAAALTDELGAVRTELAQTKEALSATLAALATAKEELGAARATIGRERVRTVAVEASHAQLKAAQEGLVKRAEELRAAFERERDALAAAHRDEREGRRRDREALQRDAAALQEKAAAAEQEIARVRRALGEAKHAREIDLRAAEAALAAERKAARGLAADHEEAVGALRSLVDRAIAALDLVLGSGARLAVRSTSVRVATAPEGALPFADALSALNRALIATGWVLGAAIVEDDGEQPYLALVPSANATSTAAHALLEDVVITWLAARAGRDVSARVVSARPGGGTGEGVTPG